MKNFLLIFLLFAIVVGLYLFATMRAKKKEKELVGGTADLLGSATKASGDTSTPKLPAEPSPASTLTSEATKTIAIPEVTRQAIEHFKALVETVTYSTLESARTAIIAKAEADVLAQYGERGEAWEEAVTEFQISKNRAAIEVAIDTGLTYYAALSALGYPIPQYMVNQRSSVDKEIDAIRAGVMTKEEVYAIHGY